MSVCTRVREIGDRRKGDEDAVLYAVDFNDDGTGGTEDEPTFNIIVSDPGLFEPGQIYDRGSVMAAGVELPTEDEGETAQDNVPDSPAEQGTVVATGTISSSTGGAPDA